MNARAVEGTEVDQNMVGLLRMANERVDRDPKAGTRAYSHTFQTRRTVNALLTLGLKRTEFSARTEYDRKTGEYKNCYGHVKTPGGKAAVTRWARELAEVGFRVHLTDQGAFTVLGFNSAGVSDHRGENRRYRMHGEEQDG